MNAEREEGDGRMRIQLSPIEKWVAAALASLLAAALGLIFRSVTTQLEKSSDQIDSVRVAQAVMQAQLTTLSVQLADVPALTRTVAEDRVMIEQSRADIRDLRGDGRTPR